MENDQTNAYKHLQTPFRSSLNHPQKNKTKETPVPKKNKGKNTEYRKKNIQHQQIYYVHLHT